VPSESTVASFLFIPQSTPASGLFLLVMADHPSEGPNLRPSPDVGYVESIVQFVTNVHERHAYRLWRRRCEAARKLIGNRGVAEL